MGLYNITEYRRAQVYVADLTKIIKILNITQSSLMNYAKYRAVSLISTTIGQYKPLLEIALEENKIIVQTKGQRK